MEPEKKRPKLLIVEQLEEEDQKKKAIQAEKKKAQEAHKDVKGKAQKGKHVVKGVTGTPGGLKEDMGTTQKTLPQLPRTLGFTIPWVTRQKCFEKLLAHTQRIFSSSPDHDPVTEAMKHEEDIVKSCFDKSIYLNQMANLLRKLEQQPVFDPAQKAREERAKKDALPGGVTLEMLEALCHRKDVLVENDYPHLEDFEELLHKAELPQTQQCARCGKAFSPEVEATANLQFREMCCFHPGRAVRESDANPQKVYSCCMRTLDGEGCCLGPHVFEVKRFKDLNNIVGVEFVSTRETFDKAIPDSMKVLAVDCEMSYTLLGMEVTRVSVVDANGEVLMDQYVQPTAMLVDLNTRFSGVTAEHLEHATLTFLEVQALFLRLINCDTILVGHSLESDLKALRVRHNRIIDTALLFPTPSASISSSSSSTSSASSTSSTPLTSAPKFSLKNLAQKHLKKVIQRGGEGHSSIEDAQTAMELVLFRAKELWDIQKHGQKEWKMK